MFMLIYNDLDVVTSFYSYLNSNEQYKLIERTNRTKNFKVPRIISKASINIILDYITFLEEFFLTYNMNKMIDNI